MLSLTATPPATPTPVEEIAAAIVNIGALHDLPLEDRLWLARHGQEVVANPGDILFEEGAPAEHMVLILKGEIHVRRQHGGPMALFIGRMGQMTGILPFSRMKGYGGQGFAVSPVWALLVHRSLFPQMLAAIPSMAQIVVSALLDRAREVTRIEQQAEKLTALGQLAGNLAHELNNPASAAQRAACQFAHGPARQPQQPPEADSALPHRGADTEDRRVGGENALPHRRIAARQRIRMPWGSSPAKNRRARGSPRLAAPTRGRWPRNWLSSV